MKFKLDRQLSVVVVLAVLTIYTASASSKCPYSCRCNRSSVACVRRDLEEIPKFGSLRANVTQLDFSMNNLEELHEDSFAFPGISQITVLILYENSLDSIEASCFENMTNLEFLDLHDNLLSTLPTNIIKNNMKLKSLNLAQNLFTKRTPIIESDSVELLDLTRTTISHIDQRHFEHLRNLRTLLIGENYITQIDYGLFLDPDGLFRLDLAHNPWACNCDTIKLFDVLTQRKMTAVNAIIQCKSDNDTFIDIYDKSGAIYSENTCSQNLSGTVKSAEIPTQAAYFRDDSCEDFFCNIINVTIVILVCFISASIVICIVTMAVLMRKPKPYAPVKMSLDMQTTCC